MSSTVVVVAVVVVVVGVNQDFMVQGMRDKDMKRNGRNRLIFTPTLSITSRMTETIMLYIIILGNYLILKQ